MVDYIKLLKEARQDLLKEREVINNKLTANSLEIKKLSNELCSIELTTKSEDLNYLLDPNNLEVFLVRKARDVWGRKYGISFFGYFTETLQPVPQISLKQNEDISLLYEGISKLKDHIIPRSDTIYFDITERTLSEHGIFSLVYYTKEDVWKIEKRVYGVDTIIFKGSLEACLKKIASRLYYN
jgi:hypothetical protein